VRESKYLTDDTLWLEALRVIKEAAPRYWVIENVKGAQQRWGRAPYHYGAYFLWGYYPLACLPKVAWTTSLKGTHCDRSKITTKNGGVYRWDDGKSASEKAMIPDELAKGIYFVINKALVKERDDSAYSGIGSNNLRHATKDISSKPE
jgi:hypothetical protein